MTNNVVGYHVNVAGVNSNAGPPDGQEIASRDT